MIEFAVLIGLVVFWPGGHFARGSLDQTDLIERGPDLASPFGIVVKPIDGIGEIDGVIYIEEKWLAVWTNGKIRLLARRCDHVVRCRPWCRGLH